MIQDERRRYLILELIRENKDYQHVLIPEDAEKQKELLRALFNVRLPAPIHDDFLKVQDEYLKEENKKKGIVDCFHDIAEVQKNICLWKGDITRLNADGIVNAANDALLGCFLPGHACIDNAIHTFAGVQLRNKCDEIMKKQGHPEPTGKAKITLAYNLPSKYIIHTVGPIIKDEVRKQDCELLKSSYLSSLKLADEAGLKSIAFCCISTGAFFFPNEIAAKIAVETVVEYLQDSKSNIKVIFDVFNERDEAIYKGLLN
ncbi:MAG: protein-ADP-ribose hydrolase [Treponema sp.]